MTTGDTLNIAFGIEAKYKFPRAGDKVEFDGQTVCKHIDIIQYTDSSGSATSINEGFLNDESLCSWIDRVRCETFSYVGCLCF
jgi:hypothetical protein